MVLSLSNTPYHKPMKTIKDFCDTHHVCPEGRAWALAKCSTMQEVWDKSPDPEWVIWMATCQGVLTDRELRLFAVWCARQVQHLLTDPRSINAIDVAERYANGEATDEELAEAWAAARAAAYDASYAADWAAPYAAAAARGAAIAAARGAAIAAAKAAARAASYAASYAVATATQAQWLRENTKPNFA